MAPKQHYSTISVVQYVRTTGLVTRSELSSTLVGYCAASPRDVLARVFPEYHVTSFADAQFFGSDDFRRSTPKIGLHISPKRPCFGITGTIADLLKLPELEHTRRSRRISVKDVEGILKNVNEEMPGIEATPYAQRQIAIINDVLNGYIASRRSMKTPTLGQELARAVQRGDKAVAHLQKARKVDPKTLRDPMTI